MAFMGPSTSLEISLWPNIRPILGTYEVSTGEVSKGKHQSAQRKVTRVEVVYHYVYDLGKIFTVVKCNYYYCTVIVCMFKSFSGMLGSLSTDKYVRTVRQGDVLCEVFYASGREACREGDQLIGRVSWRRCRHAHHSHPSEKQKKQQQQQETGRPRLGPATKHRERPWRGGGSGGEWGASPEATRRRIGGTRRAETHPSGEAGPEPPTHCCVGDTRLYLNGVGRTLGERGSDSSHSPEPHYTLCMLKRDLCMQKTCFGAQYCDYPQSHRAEDGFQAPKHVLPRNGAIGTLVSLQELLKETVHIYLGLVSVVRRGLVRSPSSAVLFGS
ncbi:hypothetical protein AAG570_009123 [Ranatra chinensis]|uniref:Uncharacterized protein n=1 Tax=Ranatra chinensis TaxID=642074 RepID=A0ABD0Z3H8_9HEMI